MLYLIILPTKINREEKKHMARPWDSLIAVLSEITRENLNLLVYCTHCGNRHTYIKWGFYTRYLFNDEITSIQRYRCDNDLCPRKTFSVPPHAFLPIIRASLCMLMHILKMHEQGSTIAGIARHTDSNWPRMQRWIAKALVIREWFEREYSNASPCFFQEKGWTSFTRNFSWAFYPDRQ